MKLFKVVRNIFFSIIYLFTINLFLSKLGYNIPINLFTLSIVYIFQFPGLILLLFLSRW